MDELFLKRVPEELHDTKTGMKICLFSDYNIGNNMFRLADMINLHTPHAARVIIGKGDYIAYDHDVTIIPHKRDKPTPMCEREGTAIVEKADIYHIGRKPLNWVGVDWNAILKPDNCVFQYWGSFLRGGRNLVRAIHYETGFVAIGPPDWSCLQGAPHMIYHIPKLYDAKIHEVVNHNIGDGNVRISHSPTNTKLKGTELFMEIMDRLEEELPCERVLLQDMDNKTCMEARATCHIHFDQINYVGFYGGAAIEGMAMGQAVVGSIGNMTLHLYPDLPIARAKKDSAELVLRRLVEDHAMRAKLGAAGREYVERVHNPNKVLKQYLDVYELVLNGLHNVDMEWPDDGQD